MVKAAFKLSLFLMKEQKELGLQHWSLSWYCEWYVLSVGDIRQYWAASSDVKNWSIFFLYFLGGFAAAQKTILSTRLNIFRNRSAFLHSDMNLVNGTSLKC